MNRSAKLGNEFLLSFKNKRDYVCIHLAYLFFSLRKIFRFDPFITTGDVAFRVFQEENAHKELANLSKLQLLYSH